MRSLNKGISVVLCCYNSATRLHETLRHLALQVIPENISWEVMVVDNASKDSTSEVARYESSRYHSLIGRFSVMEEQKPGLIYARQKGASKAKYKYLVFCDDDNWLDQDYLHNAFQIMESNSMIGALGGKSDAVTDDIGFPDWFESSKRGYAVGHQNDYEGDISNSNMLWGAGMVTRTELFFACFSAIFPSILTGRKGSELSSGEDTEYCMRLLLKGYKLYYYEKLTFTHFISKERWSEEYFERLNIAIKKGKWDASELNKYSLLHKLIVTNDILKPFFVFKVFLGFISTKLFSRRSWSLADLKVLIYYYTRIDGGIDDNTKMIYSFYRQKMNEKSPPMAEVPKSTDSLNL